MPDEPKPVPAGKPARSGHRFWIPIALALVFLGAVGVIQSQQDLDRNIRIWIISALAFLVFVLGLLWFVLLSRFPWRLRLLVVALFALAGYAAKSTLRVDGTVDARGLPRLVWRWSPPPSRPTPVASLPAESTPPAPTTARDPRPEAAFIRDVPQFFGPNRDGVITNASLSRDWSASPPRELWRQPIGSGWSAFTVVGSMAFTQEQRDETECVTCYDVLTGRLLWSHATPARFSQWQAGDGPHATPTVDGGRVYTYGATGILNCLDAATGSPMWSRSVLEENGISNLEWGISASPLVMEDLVIVTGGNSSGPTVLAFDKATGAPRWKSGTDRASYASPIAAELGGQRLVLSFNAGTLTAHNPTNGDVVLEHRWGSDKAPKGAQPVVLDGDRVFLTAGYGMGCEMFQARLSSTGTSPATGTNTSPSTGTLELESLWKNNRMKAQFNGVSARDGFLYGLDDGLLACVDATTGQRLWKDGRYGSGQSILVDDLLLVQGERGEVALAEATPDHFRELGRIEALHGKTWNHPTLAGRYLLLRNDREAVCYELPLLPGKLSGG